MRTFDSGAGLWSKSWARPVHGAEGGYVVRFAVDGVAAVVVPPEPRDDLVFVSGDTVFPLPAGSEGFEWERYNIAAADAQLAIDHDHERSVRVGPGPEDLTPRYSGERLGLVTLFSRLPLLGERKTRDAVVSEYVEWCNRWGSPGVFAFLFEVAGYRKGREYIKEKRSGRLLSAEELYGRYPEADLGHERYREPVRVEWMSREVELLRHTLTLCVGANGLGDVDESEMRAADGVLRSHLVYAGQGLTGGVPDYLQGAHRRSEDDLLAGWLWVHSSGSRLVFARDFKEGGRPMLVWTFDSFLGALYHLLQEDLTAGQLIRRCADPKCRVFFRPKRDGEYHDLKCRTRVRLAAVRARRNAGGMDIQGEDA